MYLVRKLYQIPQCSIEVFEDRYCPVNLCNGILHKFDTTFLVQQVITPKIIRPQKQKHTPSCLITNQFSLMIIRGAFKHQPGCAISLWPHYDPTIALLRLVFVRYQIKVQHINIEGNRLVVITHEKCYAGQGLIYG